MTDTLDREDRIIEEVLGLLEGDRFEVAGPTPGDDESAEILRRSHVEVLGLLPFELEPVAPAPAVKERLLATLRAQGEASRTAPVPVPAAGGVVPFQRPAAEPAPQPAPDRSPRARRWTAPLAAVLAFFLLGASGWLYLELQQQKAIGARLTQELAAARSGGGDVMAARSEVMAALRDLRVMPAGSPLEVCPLRPVGKVPPQPRARGILFIVPDSQGRWHLAVQDLEPAPDGHVYQLWFLKDGKPVRSITLGSGSGQGSLEMTAAGLPASPMDGVALTLEPSVDSPSPTRPWVLYGDAREMSRL